MLVSMYTYLVIHKLRNLFTSVLRIFVHVVTAEHIINNDVYKQIPVSSYRSSTESMTITIYQFYSLFITAQLATYVYCKFF